MLALMLVMAAVLLAAGCVEQQAGDNACCTQLSLKTANVTVLPAPIYMAKDTLESFRFYLDEKARMGINSVIAEEKYREAKKYVDSAEARSPDQYDIAAAESRKAVDIIFDGYQSLDKTWAEKTVADAEMRVYKIDGVIAWFKGNHSTSNDRELPAIIGKREVAISYLSYANDEIAIGNYSQARVWSQRAFEKANESYNDAVFRQGHMIMS